MVAVLVLFFMVAYPFPSAPTEVWLVHVQPKGYAAFILFPHLKMIPPYTSASCPHSSHVRLYADFHDWVPIRKSSVTIPGAPIMVISFRERFLKTFTPFASTKFTPAQSNSSVFSFRRNARHSPSSSAAHCSVIFPSSLSTTI